jgi:hypothetical protein
MPATQQTEAVKEDSVPKINDDIAVGEDLQFQHRWWVFERSILVLFACIVVLDVAGVFGRGTVAQAALNSPDGAMHLKYERIERYGTTSALVIEFAKSAVHDGKIQLWTSDSLVKELGNQRIIPRPSESKLSNGGFLYTFASSSESADSVEFALDPEKVGMHSLTLRLTGGRQERWELGGYKIRTCSASRHPWTACHFLATFCSAK